MRAWLAEIRTEKGYSQKRVSEEIGISQPTYWEYERGKCNPSVEVAKKIGKLLGFDWTAFFEDAEDEGGS